MSQKLLNYLNSRLCHFQLVSPLSRGVKLLHSTSATWPSLSLSLSACITLSLSFSFARWSKTVWSKSHQFLNSNIFRQMKSKWPHCIRKWTRIEHLITWRDLRTLVIKLFRKTFRNGSLEVSSTGSWSSLVAGDEGSNLHNRQSNLVICLRVLSLLFFNLKNTTAYLWADMNLHHPLADWITEALVGDEQ